MPESRAEPKDVLPSVNGSEWNQRRPLCLFLLSFVLQRWPATGQTQRRLISGAVSCAEMCLTVSVTWITTLPCFLLSFVRLFNLCNTPPAPPFSPCYCLLSFSIWYSCCNIFPLCWSLFIVQVCTNISPTVSKFSPLFSSSFPPVHIFFTYGVLRWLYYLIGPSVW